MRKIIGAMSGTSCDGLDIACCDFSKNAESTELTIDRTQSIPYSAELKAWLYHLTSGKIMVSEVAQANFYLGKLFGNLIRDFITENQLSGKIDLVVNHGQTIYHQPFNGKTEFEPPCTLQIGDGDIVSSITRCKVLSDVRIKDMAWGGQGAPMVVWADYVLFGEQDKNVVMQNIGGIGNLTFLPKARNFEKIIAFDTGPGNGLIDFACREFLHIPFDEDGQYSKRGSVNPRVLERLKLMEEDYLSLPPPKSTGKEIRYHAGFLRSIANLKEEVGCNSEDFVRTLVQFTVWTIEESFRRYLGKVDKMVVTGGGAFNPTLVEAIRKAIPETEVKVLHEVWSKFKEAIAFAMIGNEYLHKHPANVPSATGATKAVVLGKLCLPD